MHEIDKHRELCEALTNVTKASFEKRYGIEPVREGDHWTIEVGGKRLTPRQLYKLAKELGEIEHEG